MSKLTNIELDSVDFVDVPANRGSRISFFKRDGDDAGKDSAVDIEKLKRTGIRFGANADAAWDAYLAHQQGPAVVSITKAAGVVKSEHPELTDAAAELAALEANPQLWLAHEAEQREVVQKFEASYRDEIVVKALADADNES